MTLHPNDDPMARRRPTDSRYMIWWARAFAVLAILAIGWWLVSALRPLLG